MEVNYTDEELLFFKQESILYDSIISYNNSVNKLMDELWGLEK